MIKGYHDIHLPVMGSGHSADTAIRIGHLGLSSVISLVDDLLLERLRKYYNEIYKLPYTQIPRSEVDGRSKRIKAYLETVKEVVQIKLDHIKELPFFANNDKAKYFDLLPHGCEIKDTYNRLLEMEDGAERKTLETELTAKMISGSIDVNIMVKLDAQRYDKEGNTLGPDSSDAKTALKGFVESSDDANIIFSAGINQPLYTYMTNFKEFYRDTAGQIKKKIIIKVSDFRSALIQGKFLAKKGLEVAEYRIESGLNCGGHSFPSGGHLLGPVLQEFKEQRDKLTSTLKPLIVKYYEKMGLVYPEYALTEESKISVQGGIGTSGEVERFKAEYDVDYIGIGTPFLFVPEATAIDEPTLDLLIQGGEDDYYISDASPVGVQFNNIRNCGSQQWSAKRLEEGRPGSPCPKSFLVNNTEFTELPICVASSQYQSQKVEQIQALGLNPIEEEAKLKKVYEKECICDFLGNGALLKLEIRSEGKAPQSICPGPNGAWFDRTYSLDKMLGHFYGKCDSIVSAERPHVFAKEISMYVDYFRDQADMLDGSPKSQKKLQSIKDTLESGMAYCQEIAKKPAFKDENLSSIPPCIKAEQIRLDGLFAQYQTKI